ncbi:MAG TPA: DegQ family serine endoprotease [Steroidobacteraceae bacterium]|nr:DegQ family serine endoprotease [Steroidobacteraceae bacterium]
MSLHWSARRAALLFVSSVALAACSGSSNAQPSASVAPRTVAPAPSTPDAGAVTGLPDFSGLVERYGPAVVNVEVVERSQQVGGQGSGSDSDSDDPFNDFFRRFGIPGPNFGPRNAPPQHGTGSGFIVSADGYILTNAHVVSNAEQVTVRLTDRREFQAKVVGVDQRTDVAVIKIAGHGLPVVKIGDANKLRPGQWVVAIGSPFGFDNSATAGIVSATARSLPGSDNNYVPFIQTDVAVNPGNSGGPLFNVRGEVVGINSQIFSQTGGYMGLSFAIPIDVAVNVENQLIKTGRVVRGRIGVTIQDVNAQLAESFGLDRPRGALVSSVEPGGPSDKAGVKPGDVILAVDGQNIDRYSELSTEISNMKPGTMARLAVWRGGKEQEVNVTIAELNEKAERTASRGGSGRGGDQAARLGLEVRPLSPDEKQQAQTQGSLVVERASGPAAAAGVEPGDIVLGVNGKRVHSVAELTDAAKGAGKSIALLIQRQDAQIFVPLRLP